MIVKVFEKENDQVIETQVSLLCKPIYPGSIAKILPLYLPIVLSINPKIPVYLAVIIEESATYKIFRFYPVFNVILFFGFVIIESLATPTSRSDSSSSQSFTARPSEEPHHKVIKYLNKLPPDESMG